MQTALLALVLTATGASMQAPEETPETKATRKAAAWITEAAALEDAGDLQTALSYYVQASQVDPGASMAFRGAGYVLLELGRPEEAIPYLKDAIRIDPAASRPWENLGLAYSRTYDQTSRDSRELSDKIPAGIVDPEHPAWKGLKAFRVKLEERDWRTDALAALREAARLEPGEARYWYNLATTLQEYRPAELQEATGAYLKALELDDTYYPALLNLALALQHGGRRREAREIGLRLETVAGPDDPAVASLLGDLAIADRDFQEAERRYKRLLELEPDSVHGHLWLAILYRQRGDLERSQDHTEKAVALDPEHDQAIREAVVRDR